VTFDVDGINQEMHEKYRRGTDLKKVLNNLQSFALSGARVTVLTIIFKHNEKYFDDIVKMVNDYGCFDVLPIESNRFKQGPIWEFKNENGELESLEQSTNPRFRRDPKALRRRTRDHRTVHLAEDYDYITCVKAEAGSLQILNTTQVYPCCYLGSHSEVEPTGIWKSFLNGNFMLKDKSLKEIVNSEWFSYLLFESLEDKSTAMSKCKRICSMKNDEGIIAVS
jgi:MoaA/NifB/PqqE/SkfB family radical SAM enzyme